MLGLLIILIALGIGFGAGYGVRETISRRRRRAARGGGPKAQAQPQPQPDTAPAPDAGRDDVINLQGLLVAANGDIPSRRQQPPGDSYRQPEEFDGAVRDLLGELNRRPSAASAVQQ